MRKASVWVAAVLLCTTAVTAHAAKLDELDRPADYSHDSQVPSRPGGPYAILFSESFDAGIPGTWSVVDNAGGGVIWSNLAGCGESGNFTNGSGDVACASSDVFGQQRTEKHTP